MTKQTATVKTGSHSYAQGEVVTDEWVTLWGEEYEGADWEVTSRYYEGVSTHTLRVPASWIKPIGEGCK